MGFILKPRDMMLGIAMLLVLTNLDESFVTACIYDEDCAYYKPFVNCVWFFCRPPACRSDQDCVNWGYTSHFCLNTVASFFGMFWGGTSIIPGLNLDILWMYVIFSGTNCVIKREKDAVCYGNNSCISNKCIFIFGFLGLEGFGYCAWFFFVL